MPTRGRGKKTTGPALETVENGSISTGEFAAADFHGQRTQLAQLQQGVPIAAPPLSGGGPGAAGGSPSSSTAAPELVNPFAPATAAPAPAPAEPHAVADDPDLLLRVLYSRYPHPDLLTLILRREGRGPTAESPHEF